MAIRGARAWGVVVAAGLFAVLALPSVAGAVEVTDTIAPTVTSDAAASYVATAVVRLVATDEAGGSGVASLSYRVDGGATTTIGPAIALAIPVAHAGGTAPTGCACHPGIIPPAHSGGSAPAACGCHSIATGVGLMLPLSHGPHPTTGCKTCHPRHYGQTPGYPGNGECDACHTWILRTYSPPRAAAMASAPAALSTDVTVAGVATHTIELWASDAAGNESQHATAVFSVAAPVEAREPTRITIVPKPTAVRLGTSFVLTGTLYPGRYHDPCIVDARRPNSGRWSYSSTRLAFSPVGGWWYRYTPRVRGTYAFHVRFAGDPTRRASVSRDVSVAVR